MICVNVSPKAVPASGLEPSETRQSGAPGGSPLAVPRCNTNDGTIESTCIPLKPHYVYVLIDPRDNEVFYVGKGQKGRVGDHAIAARNHSTESTKVARILSIQRAGRQVTGRVVGRFDSEPEAFAVEAVLIHWMYGRHSENGQLTNIQAGHGHLHVRRRGELGEVPRLDIETRIKREPGKYSEDALRRLMDKGIPDKAFDAIEQVNNGLAQRGIRLRFDEPKVVESGRYVASVAPLTQQVVLRLQFTPYCLITNIRAAAEGSRSSRAAFIQEITLRHLTPKGKGRYAWIDDWCGNGLRFDDTAAILDRIQAAHGLFRQPSVAAAINRTARPSRTAKA